MLTRKIRVAFVVIALSTASPFALSQTYPSKPVRLIVGFAAGGNVDIPTRIVAAKLGEMWGTSVLVDNRPGAGGNIGADIAAKAAPDGYTLLICGANSHAINSALYKNMPFDPVKDFAPISQIGLASNVLVVLPSSPTNDVSAFIAYAKANPGKISVGSAGIGTSQHLSDRIAKVDDRNRRSSCALQGRFSSAVRSARRATGSNG